MNITLFASGSLADVTDGTSNTVFVVETKEPFCWMDPNADIPLSTFASGVNKPGGAGSYHAGGCNMGMADGSVRFFSETVTPDVLESVGDSTDGKRVMIP